MKNDAPRTATEVRLLQDAAVKRVFCPIPDMTAMADKMMQLLDGMAAKKSKSR